MAHLTPEAAAIVLLKQARTLKLDPPAHLASLDEADVLFRRAAILAHPDKGGDAEVMKSINEAIGVLRGAKGICWPLPPRPSKRKASAARQPRNQGADEFVTFHRKMTPRSVQARDTYVEFYVQPPAGTAPPDAEDEADDEDVVVGSPPERRTPSGVPADAESKIRVIYDRVKPGRPPQIITNLSPDDPLLAGDPYWSPFAEDTVGGAEPLEFTNVPRPSPRPVKKRYHVVDEAMRDALLSEAAKQELLDAQPAPLPEPPDQAGTPQS